jgi:positive phototaxis protein PixI
MSTPSSISRLQELLPQMFQATQLPGEVYLRFQLTNEITALLSMDCVQESLLVPSGQITPLPNMAEPVLGLMSSRNHVFLAIDLAELLGWRSLSVYSQNYHIVVVRVEGELLLGIAVKCIQGMTRLMPEKIHSSVSEFASNVRPYIRGYAMEREEKLLVLDDQAIVTASVLYNKLIN